MVKCLRVKRESFSCTVPSDKIPQALACRKVLFAVSLRSRDIIIVDAITGIRLNPYTCSFWAHGPRGALAFSSDGTFHASGSDNETSNLWDIQAGGIIRTFLGHT